MIKKFFTKASPRAASGIRRLYEGMGYEVHARLESDGSVTVVAVNEQENASTDRPLVSSHAL